MSDVNLAKRSAGNVAFRAINFKFSIVFFPLFFSHLAYKEITNYHKFLTVLCWFSAASFSSVSWISGFSRLAWLSDKKEF